TSCNEEGVQIPGCVIEYLKCKKNVVSVLKAIGLRYDASVILQSMKEAGLWQMIDRLGARVFNTLDTFLENVPIEDSINILDGLEGPILPWD
ncbi:hypothetical protein BgiBS90_026228, partial [Biomphalaria glabrata]